MFPLFFQLMHKRYVALNFSKSFGDDGISNYFLKLALPFIEDSLVYLFNTSFETSLFPDPWKIARVSPIFKDGDKTEKSNYRPISVLPVVSRLFEKLVFNQLYQYLNDNCFINSNQSGFRELHSTVTCLLKNTDDLVQWDGYRESGRYGLCRSEKSI